MVLESTMICADNSDFMRNGDFLPTRMIAQLDAINILCLSKTRSNPENNVGLLTLANVEVLVTLTADSGKILAKLHRLQPNGAINLLTAIRIAHLALKHRQGKNHKMRIVVFVGSPVGELDMKEMEKLAKKLKKEKVNVDIIHFGEEATYSEVLHTFINTLNGADGTGSHLLTVRNGPALTDALVSSPIIQGEDGAAAGSMGGGGFEFGVDPNEDPELALALRVSMEEQRQRVETEPVAATQQAVTETRTAPEGPSSSALPMEDSMLEQALAMSMEQDVQNQSGSSSTPASVNVNFATMTEEEQIAYAMQMSMQDAQVTQKTDDSTIEKMDVDESDTTKETQDPDTSKKESDKEGKP